MKTSCFPFISNALSRSEYFPARDRGSTLPALQPLVKPLHEHYLPLARRLNDAGWAPVTGVTGEGPGVLCERFGRPDSGPLYITLFNDGAEAADLVLRLDASILGSAQSAVEINGQTPAIFPVRGSA